MIFIHSRFHPVLCQNLKEMFEGGEEKSEQPMIIRHHDKRSLCLRNVKVKLFFCKLVMCVHICVYICEYIYIYTCIHISIPTLRPPLISIRCKWRCPWCIYRQCGNWSTRQASRGAGRRAGMWSSSSCFITAQTVSTQLKISLFFFKSNLYWLSSITDAVSWMEVQRLFHLSVFESLPLAERDLDKVLDQDAGLLQSPDDSGQGKSRTIIPWDDPLSFARDQLRRRHAEGLPSYWLDFILRNSVKTQKTTCFLFALIIAQTFLTSDPDSTQVLVVFISYLKKFYP